MKATNRWKRYWKSQMADPEMKERVNRELDRLRLGAALARIRASEGMTQTELAARAGMTASKISAIENASRNLELATLIRIAHALGYDFQPRFVRSGKRPRSGRR